MGHSAGIGYLLWVVAKDLVKRYGPWRCIWLCAMGHGAKPITIVSVGEKYGTRGVYEVNLQYSYNDVLL
jgi:hypothetical protein